MGQLNIQNLSKSYRGVHLLENLNLKVQHNEIVIITGASGSGKTTLLLSILGFIKPERGEIMLEGKDIGSIPIEERQLAYVPQDYGLFPHLSVRENIAFGLAVRKASKEEQDRKIRELLKMVNLPTRFSDRQVLELSGGEKQKVALARALAINPKLFLLDEPLSAIDPETRQAIGKQLRLLIKKLSIPALIVTHDVRDSRVMGDVMYKLEKGRLTKMKAR